MKRFITLIISLSLILCLYACDSDDSNTSTPDTAVTTGANDVSDSAEISSSSSLINADDTQASSAVISSTVGNDNLQPSSTTSDTASENFATSNMEFEVEEDLEGEVADNKVAVDIDSVNTDETPAGSENFNITSGGTYTFTGAKSDVMITVDAPDEKVELVLDNVTISNSKGPAIYVRSADKVNIVLADNSVNSLSDGGSYSITDSGSTLDGAVFSKADLKIKGNGTLNVTGNYKHGIVSKDDLSIKSGTVNVTSVGVALNGKDSVRISGGTITLNAGSDGIRSNNAEDASRGYISLTGGKVKVTAANDGLQAETVINMENTDLTVNASTSATSADNAYKGIKAESDIYISSSALNVYAKGNGIDTNANLIISGSDVFISCPLEDTDLLDYKGNADISGSVIAGVGSDTDDFSTSAQGIIAIETDTYPANTVIKLKSSSGSTLFSFTAECSFEFILLTSDKMTVGETYSLSVGNSTVSVMATDSF